MANRSEAQIAKDLIIEEFKFLEKLGYSVSIRYPVDDTFLEYIKVEYDNQKKSRTVIISYTKCKVFADINRSFQLTIIKLPYDDPRTDFFSQDIFLESIGSKLSSTMVNEFSKEEAGRIVREISKSLRTHSFEIINGDTWKGGYYPNW